MVGKQLATTLLALLSITATTLAPTLASAQQTYTLTDIAPWPTNYSAGPIAINAAGQIAGFTVAGGFRWTPSGPNGAVGTFSLLPLPSGGTSAVAYALNGLGQVVGSAQRAVHPKPWGYAELWQANGSTVNLVSGATAFGINDEGEVVGQGSAAFLWAGGKTYNLPGARAVGINKAGQVAGWSQNPPSSGFLWTPRTANGTTGTSITLPFVPGAINDLGQVVGPGGGISGQAVFYDGSGGVQAIGNALNAAGINNLAQVVGMGGNNHAYLWDSVHGVRDLNDTSQFTLLNAAGWVLWEGDGINDYGQIVGWGTNGSGERRLFLLTPM